MKSFFGLLLALVTSVSFAHSDFEVRYLTYKPLIGKSKQIRTGILRTDKEEVKGHIIYLQGFADSMMNHAPLFNSLTKLGYNIIAFDYMGQGGSEGLMLQTTIGGINRLASQVWDEYVKTDEKKIILGWSAGGLAAYKYAYQKPHEVEKVILLSPGIVVRYNVGKYMLVTEDTLTSNDFQGVSNPHVDPIKPASPLLAPSFASNLIWTSHESRKWKISPEVKGLFLAGSQKDRYVDPAASEAVIKKNANHFRKHRFKNMNPDVGAVVLHEIDNEQEEISLEVYERIEAFLSYE